MTKLLARLPEADLEQVMAAAAELAGNHASSTLAGESFVEDGGTRRAAKEMALARLADDRGVGA